LVTSELKSALLAASELLIPKTVTPVQLPTPAPSLVVHVIQATLAQILAQRAKTGTWEPGNVIHARRDLVTQAPTSVHHASLVTSEQTLAPHVTMEHPIPKTVVPASTGTSVFSNVLNVIWATVDHLRAIRALSDHLNKISATILAQTNTWAMMPVVLALTATLALKSALLVPKATWAPQHVTTSAVNSMQGRSHVTTPAANSIKERSSVTGLSNLSLKKRSSLNPSLLTLTLRIRQTMCPNRQSRTSSSVTWASVVNTSCRGSSRSKTSKRASSSRALARRPISWFTTTQPETCLMFTPRLALLPESTPSSASCMTRKTRRSWALISREVMCSASVSQKVPPTTQATGGGLPRNLHRRYLVRPRRLTTRLKASRCPNSFLLSMPPSRTSPLTV